MKRETITDPSGTISDSIVQRVLESGRPIIVSDATTDSQFGSSESVLALKLSSVMCAPLVTQGHVTGALYVGNDRVKGLFERAQRSPVIVFPTEITRVRRGSLEPERTGGCEVAAPMAIHTHGQTRSTGAQSLGNFGVKLVESRVTVGAHQQ